jgi:diguanylate cyclase (GGDEF)-like protein
MKKQQLSVKHYAIFFILLYVLVFIISGFIAWKDINNVNQQLTKRHMDNARDELQKTIQYIIDYQLKVNEEFAAWDEVQQQLDNPQYYTYWQAHRLFNSSVLPKTVVEVAIYDKEGKILEQIVSATLPDTINTSAQEPYFTIENTVPYLITTVRVQEQEAGSKKIRGFVSLKSEVIEVLLSNKQFDYVDSDTIKSYYLDKKYIKLNQFINYLKYTTRPNDQIHIFSSQLTQTLLRNALILIGFAFLFYFLMSYFLSRPLSKISNYIDMLNDNPEFQYMPELKLKFHILELDKVKKSLSQYQNKLQLVYTNLDEKNKELWDLAHHDALTGCLNRRAFEERWVRVKELFDESRCGVSLILFDVNHFKSINDSYGHPVGDQVLKKFSSAIEQSLRKAEQLYRIGGDEFATILHNCEPDEAMLVAERCREAISHLSFHDLDIKEPIRASIGIAHNNPDAHHHISDLLWQADIAVYEAKKPGRAHMITYSDDMKNISSSILSSRINSEVYDALETGEGITMYYQPIVNLAIEQPGYYEALIRIINKKNDIIPPGEIFQLIEARKLEYEMDLAIFRQIEKDFAAHVIPAGSGVSINVSGPSIINAHIVKDLAIFQKYLDQYKIVLEITETSLITHINQAAHHINLLKQMGFLIALDDFGSGYSSISYLSSMPVDIVKFDITLIRQLDDIKQYSIIKYLSAMIKETGHQLVAEGIETLETKEKIKQLGFNYAQGFLFGKPSPVISKIRQRP